eukprot:691945-Pyramimonas_sp.AAC.1
MAPETHQAAGAGRAVDRQRLAVQNCGQPSCPRTRQPPAWARERESPRREPDQAGGLIGRPSRRANGPPRPAPRGPCEPA